MFQNSRTSTGSVPVTREVSSDGKWTEIITSSKFVNRINRWNGLDGFRAFSSFPALCIEIELREREIERLSIALDGGRSSDILSLETRNKANEKLIAHFNIQVDFLQQANKDLEKHIQELMETKETVTSEVVNLSNKNEKLCQELTEIDQLAQQLERHKEEVLKTADKELEEAKEQACAPDGSYSTGSYMAPNHSAPFSEKENLLWKLRG
ncbi:centrosomal protein of 135 kDa-like [Muntiacus reevesi]|uniref:centrosomal protein of 135 kDa-like n=1 Tax=Muntiacus reevesi TaxID=9886 RepID=UPI003306AE5A